MSLVRTVDRSSARVLLVGLGGLGCPALMALARAGVGTVGLCDDDRVDRTNLHRQILFGEADVGAMKVYAAERAIRTQHAQGPAGPQPPKLALHPMRLRPDNALALVRQYDIVLEGSDNFATKFLTADACALAGVAAIHAAAVRWIGTVLAVGATGAPCYRCVFEDVPLERAPNCADAGILGPVAGVTAAVQVDLALGWLDRAAVAGVSVEGQMVTYDGRADLLRRRTLSRRAGCRLCGGGPRDRIDRIEPERYISPACAG